MQKRLKQAREAAGLSQEQLAEALGVAPQTVSDWERGENYPSPYFRKNLSTVLEKSAAELGLLPEDTFASYDPLIPIPMPLLGRDDTISQARQRLQSKKMRFIVLVGLPGVGKTALAATLTQDPKVRRQFDGILWAGLGPDPEQEHLLARWGRILGIHEHMHTKATWRETLRGALARQAFLLVIDDAWKLEDVFSLQVGGPTCTYLVTTRFPGLAAALTADGVIRIEELGLHDGMMLIRQLAPQVLHQEEHKVEILVQAVGGLPLALTLMGNYLRTQAYSGPSRRIVTALDRLSSVHERLFLSELLAPAASSQTGHARSLHTIIALADDYLSREAQHALHALAMTFAAKPHGFTEEEALSIVPDVQILDMLLDAGLLEWGSETSYTIHQVIADYAKTRT